MHLSPREIEKLMLHNAGAVAQKRLARGLKLNHPEAVALIAAQLLEFIRDGRTVAELMDLGRQFLGRRQVMEGVAEMLDEVQVEGTFPDGTKFTRPPPTSTATGNWRCTPVACRPPTWRFLAISRKIPNPTRREPVSHPTRRWCSTPIETPCRWK